jgi:predicted membrane protein
MVPVSLVPALVLLYFYASTFRSMCAVPNMAVFCSSFMSWFPGILFMFITTTTTSSTIVSFIIIFLIVVSEPTNNRGPFQERATDHFWPSQGS